VSCGTNFFGASTATNNYDAYLCIKASCPGSEKATATTFSTPRISCVKKSSYSAAVDAYDYKPGDIYLANDYVKMADGAVYKCTTAKLCD